MTATTQQTLRDAVADDAYKFMTGRVNWSCYDLADRILGRVAAHIASIEVERDAAILSARDPVGDVWDTLQTTEQSCRDFIRERDEWKAVANDDRAARLAAEAEVARLTARITEMEGEAQRAQKALRLAQGRLLLLMKADLPDSDHPVATGHVLRHVQAAILPARSSLCQKDADHA